MDAPAPSWSELSRLVESASLEDRAFAAGELQLRFSRDPDRARELYSALGRRSLEVHAEARARIRSGTLRGAALRALIEQTPAGLRDHFVEELLDVAYPPLEPQELSRELVTYCPSGWTEIAHALDHTHPTALVDLGSGLGKVVLLTALLTNARAHGIELDPALVHHAQNAATSLDVATASFACTDARDAPLPDADVFYLYVPFTGAALTAVLTRLQAITDYRPIVVCSQALDTTRHPWLRSRNTPSFWLEIYDSV
jgi:hypothetical protein